jgi:opacity protein-like surface antigen
LKKAMRANVLKRIWAAGMVALAVAGSGYAVAQEAAATRGFFSVKAGANAQSAEDNENGTSLGFGFGLGFWASRRWGFEFEAWLPDYIEQGGKQFRDRIYSGSVLFRTAPHGRATPYLLGGIGIAQVQSRSEFGNYSNGYQYLQVGGGVEITLHRHLAIAPELRADIGRASVILRPAIAAVIRF